MSVCYCFLYYYRIGKILGLHKYFNNIGNISGAKENEHGKNNRFLVIFRLVQNAQWLCSKLYGYV